jgi:glucosamine--fructose-6-phosphate aminotransferase (isomerizing)
MCGIVGYVGASEAPEILLTGLKRLEYRGYDSAGMATATDGELFVERSVGHVRELYNRLVDTPLPGTTGIAHTRWATHGGPTEVNAHPHVDATGRIAGVHNGIIENHAQIRAFLEGQGIQFCSETDSEALVQLVGFFYRETGELLDGVRQALRNVRGTYGIVFVCADAPDKLIAARRGSPLLLGAGTDEFFVSSDANALVGYAAQISHLQDDEIVVVTREGVHATSVDEKPTERKFEVLDLTLDNIELGEYAHHMFKEIQEQPESLRNAMRGRVDGESAEVNLGGLAVCEREMPRVWMKNRTKGSLRPWL